MECITNLEALKEWRASTLSRGAVTNCYLGPAHYQKYVHERSLYFLTVKGARFLFHDLGECDKMYYCFNEKDLPCSFDSKDSFLFTRKPNRLSFTEILYKETSGPPENILTFFDKIGFKNHIKRMRMFSKNSDFKNALEASCKKEKSVIIRLAREDDAALVLQMISEAFDPYTSCIPKLDEFLDIIAQNRVIAAFDTYGQLLGAFHFEVEKSTAFVNHIVVSENARGKGVAGMLLAQGRALCDRDTDFGQAVGSGQSGLPGDADNPDRPDKPGGGTRIGRAGLPGDADNPDRPGRPDRPLWRLWVRQDNAPAQSMYLKYAFKFDGTCCLSILNGPPQTAART